MKDLIILDCEQGSEGWKKARVGIPTGTGIKNIITASGKVSTAWNSYLAELVAESIKGVPDNDSLMSADIERGKRLEPEARAYFQLITGYDVEEVGGVFLNENKELMISPDGLIPELKSGLEIKSPRLKNHIEYILNNEVPAKYVIQIQSAMWVTGCDSWIFMSYCPDYEEQPAFTLTVTRDPLLMQAFDRYIPVFLEQLRKLKGAKYES